MENNDLQHWGIKGMKWGVRRYQTKSGSLTPAGQKRYEKKIAKQRKEALEKARETRAKKRAEEAERQKKLAAGKLSPKKMTDEELKARIERLELEKKYTDAMKNSRIAHDRGKRFLDKFLDSAVDKTAENVAADVVAQTIKVAVVKGTNQVLKKTGLDADVHTNNKKK